MAQNASKTKRIPTVGYIRVSTPNQVEKGGSLADQRTTLACYAAANGLDLIAVYEDAGISGAKNDDHRPGLASALELIRDGKAKMLLVSNLARLARGMDLTGYLRVAVQKAGGVVHVIGESEDQIYRLVETVSNELYRIAVSKSITAWNAGRKAKGLPAGPAPFGYRVGEGGHLEPVEILRPIIDYILEWRDAGVSLRRIATGLNNDGVPGPKGGLWNQVTVMNVVRRERA